MILNSNFNYNDANFNFSQHPVIPNTNIINKNINFINPNYPNYSSINNINNVIPGATNFSNQIHPYANPSLAYPSHINTLINTFNAYNPKISNNFNMQYSKNFFLNQEKLELECICDKQTFESKNDLKQCILCHKYQHIECIHQAQEITPYLCFNCQFKNVHFYLRWKKTILPAKEFIYKKKWEDDISLLKQGTKKFEFYLNLKELYETFTDTNNNNSYYLAFLCLTNNGKPFHLGFPDNINIEINDKKFYNTESKGFKRPLLLALENNKYYVPKKRHLITLDKYEIPNASNFFNDKNNFIQKITISFANNLENYRGSEFEFVEIRHYLIYIGVFQEIQIPQLSILRECKKLEEYFQVFKNFYKEKVIKMKWNKISNFVSLGNEQLNMNMFSEVSNQKIISPIRGLFCQHTEVMDFGECCGYITSNNQVYKCSKCNKPLNIMYIDDMSEKIFNKYKNSDYSLIYFNSRFKLIKGEVLDNNKKNENKNKISNNNDVDNEEDIENDSMSESFFQFYEKKNNKDDVDIDDNNNDINDKNNNSNDVIQLSDSESINENNDISNNTNNNDNNNDISNINNSNYSPAYPADNNFNINNAINNDSNNNTNTNNNEENINIDKSNDSNSNSINNNDENNVINNLINRSENNDVTNEENKINEEVITLIEDDDEDEEKNEPQQENSNSNSNTNSYFNNINNNMINNNKEKDKEIGINKINENVSSSINNTESNNINNKSSDEKGDQNEYSSDNSNNVQSMISQKNKKNIFNVNISKKNEIQDDVNASENELGEKKRNKILNKKHKRNKEKNKEKNKDKDSSENNIFSPRKKRILKRIEKSPMPNKEKEKEKIKKNYIKEVNVYKLNTNINNKINDSNNSNSNESLNKKNIRRNSDLNSSSNNSYNSPNNINIINNTEYTYNYNINNNNKNNKNKKKKIKEKEKDKNLLFISPRKKKDNKENNNQKKHEKNNEFIPLENINIINNMNNIISSSDDVDEDNEEYETIFIERKDLIEVRPYNEYKEKKINRADEEDEFLNDFDIFENGLLNNKSNEFLNYDYYNIQRKLREFCSIRYQDDEIFNGNKSFFNKFN